MDDAVREIQAVTHALRKRAKTATMDNDIELGRELKRLAYRLEVALARLASS